MLLPTQTRIADCHGGDDTDEITGPVNSVLPSDFCTFSSFSQGMPGVQFESTLGTVADDQVFSQEINIQKQFYFGIPSQYLLINEGSPDNANAYASPNGFILFGVHLYRRTIAQYGGLAVAGVLAHEGGHRVQQVSGWVSQNPIQELEADAFSGFYQALVKRWAWSQIQGYFANVYAAGDFGFNSPQHHGTPT